MENIKKKNKLNKGSNLKKKKSSFKSKVVQMRRVSKTVKGGKKLTFSVVIIVGDEEGKVGVGIGRANDISEAVTRATFSAKKHLFQVPVTTNDSIPHITEGKFGASQVLIKPAKAGTGVIAGGSVRTVLELAGLKNILAKQLGSNNILNNARATLVALSNLQIPKDLCKDRDISFKIYRKRIINFYKN